MTVYTDTQALYFTLDNMALILDVPFNKLRLSAARSAAASAARST